MTIGWFFVVVIGLLFIGGLIGDRTRSEKVVNQHLMEELGETKEARRDAIKAHFARDTGKISMLLDVKKPERCRIFLERNLATVEPIEVFSLETAYHLFNEGFIDDHNFFLMRLGLFYADGQGLEISYKEYRDEKFSSITLSAQGMQDLSRYNGMTLGKSVTHALNQLEGAREKYPDNAIYQELYQKYEGGNKLGGGQFDLDRYITKG